MKVINERSQIHEVADRWKEQYYHGGQWDNNDHSDRKLIYQQLASLDRETANAADVAKIIGNSTWVDKQTCDECRKQFECVVQLGGEPDYESSTASICLACLKKAVKLSQSPVRSEGAVRDYNCPETGKRCDRMCQTMCDIQADRLELLTEALSDLSDMYAHVWDRVDGALVMLPQSIKRFERAHAKARIALRRPLEHDKASAATVSVSAEPKDNSR